MEPSATGQQAMDRDQEAVHDWRVSQLVRLGFPGTLAEIYADRIDWHQVARLVRGAAPPGSPSASSCDAIGVDQRDDRTRELA